MFDQTASGYLKAALTSNVGDPAVEGDLTASPEAQHALRLNLRAVIEADALRDIFVTQLQRCPVKGSLSGFDALVRQRRGRNTAMRKL